MRAADAMLARRAVKGRTVSAPRAGRQWASSLDRSPMRQRDCMARIEDADPGQSIAAVAAEPQIRRGVSADLGCYNLKTKDRCQTPTRGLWFSNTSGAAHHLPDLPERQVVFMRRL